MTNNYPIDDALNNMEDTFEITLMHKETGVIYRNAPVQMANTLGQVLEEYAEDIGVNAQAAKILFTNKRTGDETASADLAVAKLNLKEGDVLVISDNAGVA